MAVGALLVGGSIKETEEVKAAGTITSVKLVTSKNDLAAGSNIYIGAKLNDGNYTLLSKTQNSNNRGKVGSYSMTNNELDFSAISADAQVITLEKGTGDDSYYLSVGNGGYLYAASSSKNYLRTQQEKNLNGDFNVSIGANGVATLQAQGSNTRNLLKYNPSSSIFSCYGSSSNNLESVYIFKVVEEISTTPSITMVTKNSELILGHDTALTIDYEVANVDNPVITWSSSNGAVASVDNGVVTPLSAGETDITAKIEGTDASASIKVVVRDFSTEIVVNNEITIDATNKPDNIVSSYIETSYGTLGGGTYLSSQVMINSSRFQLKSELGFISNLNPYSKNIKKIILNKNTSTNANASWSLYAQDGLTALDEQKKITPTNEGNTYTYDFSSVESKNFTLKNTGSNVLYIDSIVIEFTEKYEIMFDEDNGNEYSKSIYAGDSIVLETPVKNGYVFKHWVDVNNGIHTAGETFTPTGDDLLVAIYEVGDILKSVNTESKLNFSYTKHVSDSQETIASSTFDSTNESYIGTGYAVEGENAASKLGFVDNEGLEINCKQNSASNNLRFYGSHLKFYAKNIIEIKASNIKEIKIDFIAGDKCAPNLITIEDLSGNSKTAVTGTTNLSLTLENPVNGLILTNTDSAQQQIKSISITYSTSRTSYYGFNNMIMGFGATIPTEITNALGTITSAGVLVQKVQNETDEFSAAIKSGMDETTFNALDADGTDIMLVSVNSDLIKTVDGGIRVDGYISYPDTTEGSINQSWNTLVKAAVYVVANGKVYVSTSQTFSVKTKLEAYLTNSEITLTNEQRNVITALLADTTIWGA